MDFFTGGSVVIDYFSQQQWFKVKCLNDGFVFFLCRFSLYITLLDGLKLLDCLWIIVIFFFL